MFVVLKEKGGGKGYTSFIDNKMMGNCLINNDLCNLINSTDFFLMFIGNQTFRKSICSTNKSDLK